MKFAISGLTPVGGGQEIIDFPSIKEKTDEIQQQLEEENKPSDPNGATKSEDTRTPEEKAAEGVSASSANTQIVEAAFNKLPMEANEF